jgi:hypothetical protein
MPALPSYERVDGQGPPLHYKRLLSTTFQLSLTPDIMMACVHDAFTHHCFQLSLQCAASSLEAVRKVAVYLFFAAHLHGLDDMIIKCRPGGNLLVVHGSPLPEPTELDAILLESCLLPLLFGGQ